MCRLQVLYSAAFFNIYFHDTRVLLFPSDISQQYCTNSHMAFKMWITFFSLDMLVLVPLDFHQQIHKGSPRTTPCSPLLMNLLWHLQLTWPRLIVADPAKCGIEGALAAATIICRCLAIRQEHKLKLYMCEWNCSLKRLFFKDLLFWFKRATKKGIYIYMRIEAQGLTCHKLIYHLFLWAGERYILYSVNFLRLARSVLQCMVLYCQRLLYGEKNMASPQALSVEDGFSGLPCSPTSVVWRDHPIPVKLPKVVF